MKILIVGTDLNSIILAQYIKLQNKEHDIYLTSEYTDVTQFYTPINIQETDIQSICDFVKYNQIEFTIVTSSLSIINGIADIFKKEGFPIFAPFAEAARITYFNSIAKKIMYKLKINTPKFGIFDRENLATDYIRRSKFPIVIENDFTLLYRENNIYDTFSKAKLGLQKIFENNNEKIVIENYIDSTPLYLYFITDGYNALPLISIERNSGAKYSSTIAPCEKISGDMRVNILQKAIYPILDDIIKYAGGYTGIIGLKLKLANENFYILEFYNGFQHYDLQTFLSILNEDFFELIYDATNGCLADKHDYIKLNENFAYTIAIDKDELIDTEDTNEFIETSDSNKKIYTNTASTINYSRENLIEYIETIAKDSLIKRIKASEEKRIVKI